MTNKMNENPALLQQISSDLGIAQYTDENLNSLMQRIIYSAVARNAYYSLWDVPDNSEPVSIIHFKNRAIQLLQAFRSLYPESMQTFRISNDEMVNELYSLYQSAGYLYHMPNRILPAKEAFADCLKAKLFRAPNPGRKVRISGSGAYLVLETPTKQNFVSSLFRLHEDTLADRYQTIAEMKEWQPINPGQNAEYLRTFPPFSQGYWHAKPDTDGRISLLRFGMPGSKLYYYYQYKDKQLYGLPIPGWQSDEFQYRTLSTCILDHLDTLPPILWENLGSVIKIDLNYLLPPSEMVFMKLYSWPSNFNKLPSDFSRLMHFRIFEIFKSELERQGYHFKKRNKNE